MSILSGPEIVRIVERTRAAASADYPPVLPLIDIDPFDPARAGPNSYDVSLGDEMKTYCVPGMEDHVRELHDPDAVWWPANPANFVPELDTARDNPTVTLAIRPDGIILRPGVLYLGRTVERTRTVGVVPWLDGRSSVGRLGVQIHMTAGRGDDGFGDNGAGGCSWTLEITVTHPVRVRPGLRVGQLTFFKLVGDRKPYAGRYQVQTDPTASRLHEERP